MVLVRLYELGCLYLKDLEACKNSSNRKWNCWWFWICHVLTINGTIRKWFQFVTLVHIQISTKCFWQIFIFLVYNFGKIIGLNKQFATYYCTSPFYHTCFTFFIVIILCRMQMSSGPYIQIFLWFVKLKYSLFTCKLKYIGTCSVYDLSFF